MTEDLQTALRDETGEPDSEDREMEEADAAYQKELGSDMVDVAEPKKEETAEQNQRILAALGFKRYEDSGVVKYNIRVLDIKIGVTFNETNPLGKIWAYKIPEGDEEKEFLKNGDLKQHPLIQKYHAIQEGKQPMPEISVTGKITEKRGKAIKVEIEENGEKKEIFFGQGAVKKDNDGYFIPAGFSKAVKDKHDAKMTIPRNIRLPNYETEFKKAPTEDTTEEGKNKEEVAKSTIADKITAKEPPEEEYTDMREQVIIEELIKKYLYILERTTKAVRNSEVISDREKGYGTNWVCDSVKDALKGGDHEEEAQ